MAAGVWFQNNQKLYLKELNIGSVQPETAETILLFIDLLALFSVFSEPKGAGQVLGWYLYTTHKYTKYTPCYNLRTFFPPQEYSMTALFT
jgi:hypothetical protein